MTATIQFDDPAFTVQIESVDPIPLYASYKRGKYKDHA